VPGDLSDVGDPHATDMDGTVSSDAARWRPAIAWVGLKVGWSGVVTGSTLYGAMNGDVEDMRQRHARGDLLRLGVARPRGRRGPLAIMAIRSGWAICLWQIGFA